MDLPSAEARRFSSAISAFDQLGSHPESLTRGLLRFGFPFGCFPFYHFAPIWRTFRDSPIQTSLARRTRR